MSAVTLPVPSEFERFCQRAHLAPEQVLAAFMSDLAAPTRLPPERVSPCPQVVCDRDAPGRGPRCLMPLPCPLETV